MLYLIYSEIFCLKEPETQHKDCEWLAKLLQCGLIKGSFIPPKWVRELRDLTRYRKQVVHQMNSEKNRIQKILQDANIQLSSVATNVFGVSGTNILKALLNGETDSDELIWLAVGKLRSKNEDLRKALDGEVTPHHLFMIPGFLDHIEYLQKSIQRLDEEVCQKLKPYKEDYERLQSIPGVKGIGAGCVLGTMNRRVKKSGKTRPGNVWLQTTLVEAAHGASRSKGTYLKSKYHKVASHRGRKRVLIAVGHKILIAAYYILRDKKRYADLGEAYLEQRQKRSLTRYYLKKLDQLGIKVRVDEPPAPPIAA